MGEPPEQPLPPTTRLGVGASLMGYFMLVIHFPDQVNYTHCCHENHTENPQKQQVNNDLYISNIFLVAGFAFYQPGVLFGLLLWFTKHNWALFSSFAFLLLSVILLTTSVIMKALAVCLNTCGSGDGTSTSSSPSPSNTHPNPLLALLGTTLCLATTAMICLMISFCRRPRGDTDQEDVIEPQQQTDLLQHHLQYQASLPYHEGYKQQRHSPTEGTSLKEIQEIPYQRNTYSKGLPHRM